MNELNEEKRLRRMKELGLDTKKAAIHLQNTTGLDADYDPKDEGEPPMSYEDLEDNN